MTLPANPASAPTAIQVAALQQAIATCMQRGWRLESQSPFTAIMVSGGRKPSTGLHLMMSVVTLGLWIPVWIWSAWRSGWKRIMVAADPEGNISYPVIR